MIYRNEKFPEKIYSEFFKVVEDEKL